MWKNSESKRDSVFHHKSLLSGMSNLAHSREDDQKVMSEIKQETDQCSGADQTIDSVLCAQQILLDRLRSLNFQSKNVNDNHQHIDSWTDHQLPELARKILQLLSQTVSNWHLFEDDSNDAAEDDSEALTNDKLETLNQFVRSFLDFNKDYFSVNHNHWTSEDSHSDMALSDEDENDESIERISTRSTRRRQQQQQQVTSPKSSVKQRAKNKNAKQSSPNQTTTNEKAMTTKLSTDKFLIDCSSSLMLK